MKKIPKKHKKITGTQFGIAGKPRSFSRLFSTMYYIRRQEKTFHKKIQVYGRTDSTRHNKAQIPTLEILGFTKKKGPRRSFLTDSHAHIHEEPGHIFEPEDEEQCWIFTAAAVKVEAIRDWKKVQQQCSRVQQSEKDVKLLLPNGKGESSGWMTPSCPCPCPWPLHGYMPCTIGMPLPYIEHVVFFQRHHSHA